MNANGSRQEWSLRRKGEREGERNEKAMVEIEKEARSQSKLASKRRFSLLNDAQNGSILILHAIFADNKEIDENR